MAIPRMRTAEGVLAEIKTEDPNTDVTLHYIRGIIHANKIPVVLAGRKKLVDMDDVVAHLTTGKCADEPRSLTGQIRRVAV